MILVKAPLRISFVGGGTDLPAFYSKYPGRVLSTTIDKFVYVVINQTPLVKQIVVKYQQAETVSHPSHIKHPSIREALLEFGVVNCGIEIGSFADWPSRTGLGSSSSFATALMRGLYAYFKKEVTEKEVAEAACRLEIDRLGEPIGKQDQYAAAYGGFNRIQFNPDQSIQVETVNLKKENQILLKSHMMLFFTGITRSAARVLRDQNQHIDTHIDTYRKMADSVFHFEECLRIGDIEKLSALLHDGWMLKKSLGSKISNSTIDILYESGIANGALGGKILGAGGGGCILFFAPPEKQPRVKKVLYQIAQQQNLSSFKEIFTDFSPTGTEVVFNNS